jgi:hypothetical protein
VLRIIRGAVEQQFVEEIPLRRIGGRVEIDGLRLLRVQRERCHPDQ